MVRWLSAAFVAVAAVSCSATEDAQRGDRADTSPALRAEWGEANEQLATQNRTFPQTVASDVSFHAPLPASVPAHPPACDELHVLRIRHVTGPVDPADADRLLIAQPGVIEGASAFYNVAGNLVTRAYEEQGKYVEFWAVDRRPNCLEDNDGLRLAKATGNPRDLIDYYYRNKAYRNHRFAGYLDPFHDAAWLAEMGLEQTILDFNAIIAHAVPDRTLRQQKVYCGGHSLGGFIAGSYANWDFDGDPATTEDAGFNQCAGFFALDSAIQPAARNFDDVASTLLDLVGVLVDVPEEVVSSMRDGQLPRFVSVPGVIDPEIMNMLTGIAVAADMQPNNESDLVTYLPMSDSVDGAERLYHSQSILDFLAFSPTVRDFRYTNQALLGVFTDDNSMPLFFVNASVGFFRGGPVTDKEFPFDNGGVLAIPTDAGDLFRDPPLYDWANYDEVAAIAIPKNAGGEPFTSPASEVTDLHDLARTMAALPLNFVEGYFPLRLAIDSVFGASGAVHSGGIYARPVIEIVAGESPPLAEAVQRPGSPSIPGYNHLDVMTAAPVQNDAQPEPVTTELLKFLFSQ